MKNKTFLNRPVNSFTAIFVSIIFLFSGSALFAQEKAEEIPKETPKPVVVENGFIPGVVSIFPGVILHGSGLWMGDDPDAAYDLMIMEGIGVGAILVSITAMALTGASPKVSGPMVPVTAAGSGLFFTSWLADLYGSFLGSRPVARMERGNYFDISSGYWYVYDPQFKYQNLLHFSFEKTIGGWSFSPKAWIALDDDNQKYLGEISYQFMGPRSSFFAEYKNKVEFSPTLRYSNHNYGSEKFIKHTADLSAVGRFFMGSYWKSLDGSFTVYELGFSTEWVNFTIENIDIPIDYNVYFIFTFGYGIFLGSEESPLGEIVLFYNHRRDDYAGGMGIEGAGQGVLGYCGLNIEFFIGPYVELEIELKAGSALIAGVKASAVF
ncbi:MAG: hypothetical protein GY754_34385 [bacterium]|nr:hypothetical protein [bacterium]